jgi:exopolyphosphatase/guanosine-5'-triphosphate,3'-diphosphate pyrophosphatase
LLRTLLDTTEVVRLGTGLEKGVLDEETMRHGVDVVRKLVRLAGDLGAKPRLVGTMALRTAQNAGDFIRQVRDRTGISVEVLSGEEEARLAWLGAVYGLDFRENPTAVFDTGGGSTEFILGAGNKIRKSKSVPVGAVFLTEKFFDTTPTGAVAPVKPEAVDSARQYIQEILAQERFADDFLYACACDPAPFVIGLGGGVVAMASVKLGLTSLVPDRINGTSLTRKDIDDQLELYARSSLEERMKIVGLPPKRADIILASACIVQCALEALKADSFRVSINGLRHGLLIEMFGMFGMFGGRKGGR